MKVDWQSQVSVNIGTRDSLPYGQPFFYICVICWSILASVVFQTQLKSTNSKGEHSDEREMAEWLVKTKNEAAI